MLLDNITLKDRQRIFKEITMGEPAFTPKAFHHHYLQPEFQILCDFVQKVFLSHQGTFETVTPQKFQNMVAVIMKLDVN